MKINLFNIEEFININKLQDTYIRDPESIFNKIEIPVKDSKKEILFTVYW